MALVVTLRWLSVKRPAAVNANSSAELQDQLISAASEGQTERVIQLVAAGVNIDGWGSHTLTALHAAIANGHSETVRTLIAKGADIRAPASALGDPPLHTATLMGNSEIVKILLSAGAEVNARNRGGDTPLLIASFTCRCPNVVSLLLENGALTNMTSNWGNSPLINAAEVGDADTVRILISHGADVSYETPVSHWTALKRAKEHNHQDIVKIFKRAGAKH